MTTYDDLEQMEQLEWAIEAFASRAVKQLETIKTEYLKEALSPFDASLYADFYSRSIAAAERETILKAHKLALTQAQNVISGLQIEFMLWYKKQLIARNDMKKEELKNRHNRTPLNNDDNGDDSNSTTGEHKAKSEG